MDGKDTKNYPVCQEVSAPETEKFPLSLSIRTADRIRIVSTLHDYRRSLYINTLFYVKEIPKKALCRCAGPLVYDLTEIMAK